MRKRRKSKKFVMVDVGVRKVIDYESSLELWVIVASVLNIANTVGIELLIGRSFDGLESLDLLAISMSYLALKILFSALITGILTSIIPEVDENDDHYHVNTEYKSNAYVCKFFTAVSVIIDITSVIVILCIR